MERITIRTIQPADNKAIAIIIRNALAEFGANKPGTVYYDETTDHLYELFQLPGSVYYILEDNGRIAGGAGIFPSPDLPENTAELVKMYLEPSARGKGWGQLLINRCLEFAKTSGYLHIYLETMPELKKAMGIYEKFGFRYLNGPLGKTGHFGCGVWMLKDLIPPSLHKSD
jgi:putative acetyltransferase